MCFREFDLAKVQQKFGLSVVMADSLFPAAAPVTPSETLTGVLRDYGPVGTSNATEKARSELLIAPMLAEVWLRSAHRISMLSGVELNVDEAAGLNGVCDFLLTRGRQMLFVTAPILVVVEAKRDNIVDGFGQCAAEMVAVQRFNKAEGTSIDPVYGCVSTGSIWKFLTLSAQELRIDLDEYLISQPERILGVLLHCCGVSV